MAPSVICPGLVAESYFTAMLAVLAVLLFSAVKAPATVVWLVGAFTVPTVSMPLIGWLKPVMPTWIPGL